MPPMLYQTEPTVFLLEKLHQSATLEGIIATNCSRLEALGHTKQIAIEALYGMGATIAYDRNGVPTLLLPEREIPARGLWRGDGFSLSVSHSSHYLALLAAPPSQSVGIDIEAFRPQVLRIVPRFLSESELQLLDDLTPCKSRLAIATQMWCAKEAAFKALAPLYPCPDFRGSYRITNWLQGECTLRYTPNGKRREKATEKGLEVSIQFFLHPHYCLSWCKLPKDSLL